MVVVQSGEAQSSASPEELDANEKKNRLRQRFEVVKKLGQGTYGKVQLAINKETQQEVAIKTIKKARIENEQDMLRIRREIQIMSSIHHPHIIHIYEVFENAEKIVLVMQYASGGELYDYLGCHKKLPEKEARRIFRQIATAIYYCHKYKICHRDLKLENILLDDKGNAKIADFGLSNMFDGRRKLHTFCGSPLYASPEIVKGMPYSGPEVDCWSLGVLLYTMVYGAMPFDGSNFKRLVKQIYEGDYYEPKLKSGASGIIRRLLTVDVSKRATIKEVCTDVWVNEGYDHSLLQIANDMACLTPVSLNSTLLLSPLPTKNAGLQIAKRNDPAKYNFPKCEGLNKGSRLASAPKRFYNDALLSKKFLSVITRNNAISRTTQSSTTLATNDISSEVASVLKDILSRVEKGLGQMNTNQSHAKMYDHKYNVATRSGRLLEKIKASKNQKQNHELDISCNRFHNLSSEENNFCMVNGDVSFATRTGLRPVIDRSLLSVEKYPARSDSIRNNRAVDYSPGHIPSNEVRLGTGRHLPVGNFGIRSASEKTKQNNENIVPIFNVTSVIPQRTRGAYSVQNNNVNTVSDHSYESVHSSDVQTNIYYPSNKTSSSATKNDQLNATVSCFRGDSIHKNDTFGQKTDGVSYSQDRNDMLYILNQICHQRKLSCGRKQRLLSESMWQPKDEANVLRIHTESPNVFDTDISTFSTATTLKISKEPSQGSLRNGETEINNTEEQDQAELVSKMPSSSNVTETLTVPSSSSETTRHTENEASVSEEAKLEQETENPSKESSVPETPAFEVDFEETSCTKELNGQSTCSTDETEIKNPKQSDSLGLASNHENKPSSDIVECPVDQKNNDFSSEMAEFVEHRQSRNSRSVATKKTVRSLSADDENRTDTLERILRRPRKYSLCALLAATFELERTSLLQNRRASEGLRKLPGKVEIPKSFDPSSESESGTPVEKKEIVLFPTVTVAENKQKIENKIEKVKNSALSMKIRRKSEASTRKKLKKYTRSCTDVFQCIGNANLSGSTANDVQKSLPSFSEFQGGSCEVASNLSISAHGESESGENLESDFLLQDDHNEEAEVAEGKTEAYVPITRCCKKIMFLPVSSKSYEPDEIKQSVCPQTDQERTEKGRTHVREIENGLPGRKEATRENTKPQETTKTERARRSDSKELENSLHCKFDQSKILKSNDSLNNSSLDKDSSDNDDEDLDPMIFDAQLEACETADLWKFLKTINNNLSCKIKKVAKLHSQPVYNRSKSQECQESDGSNRISENVLIRSRSKDEAPGRQSAKETLESLEDIGDSISSFEMLSFDCRELKNFSECDESTNHSESMPDTASSSGFFDNPYRTFRPKSMSAKYYSSSNLLDSSTFLSESSLQSNPKNESYNSSVNLSYGDSTPINDEMHSALCKNISVYGTLRPRSLAKSERTKTGFCTEETEQSHLVTLRASKQNSSVEEKRFPALNNKALSDMDISYRVEAPLSNSSPPVLSKGKVLQSSSRFAKSLGSKLDLQPRSILTDSASKDSLNKPKDDKMPKKHRRKVSFTSDSLKQRNTTFAMESLAKAQKILCESESNISSNPPDETGTLLEALKTHGYKTLISQRLQENAPDDNETTTHSTVFLRGLNSCNFANIFASNLYDSLNTDALEYARIMHIRRLMSSFSNAYNQFRDPDYTELPNGLHETTSHGKTDTSWCKIPSAWLHQNTETMRHSKPCVMPVKDVRGVENDLSQLCLDARYEIKNQPAESRLSGLNIRTPCQSQRQYFTHAEQEILNETSTENSVEKLAMRIQALKSRYHQRSSDEHNKKRIFTQSLEFEEEDLSLKKPDNKYLEVKQSLFDSGFAEKREEDNEESVSDRIWRKSFYPRFNDTSTLKKRRSMLLETDYCSDETPQQSTKLRLQTKNLPREHDGRYEKRNMKAQNELLLDSRESQKNESSSQKTEQSIPSRTEPSEVEKEWPKEEIQETKRNE